MLPKNSNRLWIAKEIQLGGVLSSFPCDYCASRGVDCFVMEPRPKCDKCTHRGHPCVGVSWESLDRTRLSLQKQISRANSDLAAKHAELAALSSKVMRLQKTLDQADHRATEKADCLAAELGSDNDGTEDEAPPELSQFVDSLSPSFWDSIVSPPQNVEASSHSSWGFPWVPKLTLRYHILSTWQGSGVSH